MDLKPINAVMLRTVTQLGSGLCLPAGMPVCLFPATNQPDPQGKWFARPYNGLWDDGIKRDLQDSVLLEEKDEDFVRVNTFRDSFPK